MVFTKKDFLRILSFFIFPTIVFIFNFYAGFLYDLYSWFDILMHFLGGFSIAFTSVLFLNFFEEKKLLKIKSSFLFIFIVVSFVSLIAILWEFYEFILRDFFNVIVQISLEDTLSDLLMGIGGGFVGSIVFRKI